MQALLRAMLTQVDARGEGRRSSRKDGDGDFTFRLCEGLFIAKKA